MADMLMGQPPFFELMKHGGLEPGFSPGGVVVAGGVIPAQDYDYLYKAGVAGVFGPGTPIATAGKKIMEVLLAD